MRARHASRGGGLSISIGRMDPTPAPEPPRAAPDPAPAWRFRDVYVQALFTLIAVVLAFAVEEWREERELDRIVEEARQAIVQELQHNREELLESRRDTLATVKTLETAVATPGGTASPALRELGFELALLSTAAWRSAQSMDVARRIDQTWMLQAARAYELQALYEQTQWSAVEANMDLKASNDDAIAHANARALLARIRLLAGFSKSLESDYDGLL